MSWSLIEKVLDEAGKHSTWLGKIWIIALFFFRILVLIRIADTVYSDEQSNFRCNHRQPGCENVCFSEYSPFSFTRFTAFQIIVVALPTIVYILYAAHMVAMNRQLNPTGTQANILRCKMDRRQIQLQSQGLGLTLAERTKLKQQRELTSKKPDRMKSSTYSKAKSMILNRNCSDPPPYRTHPNSSYSSHSTGFFGKIRGRLNQINENQVNTYQNCKNSGSESSVSVKSDIYMFDEYKLKPRKRNTKYGNSSAQKHKYTNNRKNYLKNHASNIDRITLDAKLLKQRLSKAYAIHALIRTLLEVAMTIIQYRTFPWIVSPLYKCNQWPCPNVVDCFISRPREKTYITQFLMCTSLFCVVINFLDLHWLGVRRIKKALSYNKDKVGVTSAKLVSANDVLRMARAGGVEALAKAAGSNVLAKDKNKFFRLQCAADKAYDAADNNDTGLGLSIGAETSNPFNGGEGGRFDENNAILEVEEEDNGYDNDDTDNTTSDSSHTYDSKTSGSENSKFDPNYGLNYNSDLSAEMEMEMALEMESSSESVTTTDLDADDDNSIAGDRIV